MKKYKLVSVSEETRKEIRSIYNIDNAYRIEALCDFGDVHKGDLGGYVECEENLSQEGNCWIYDNSIAYDDSYVYGDAKLLKNSCVSDSVIGGDSVLKDTDVMESSKVINTYLEHISVEESILIGDFFIGDSRQTRVCDENTINRNIRCRVNLEIDNTKDIILNPEAILKLIYNLDEHERNELFRQLTGLL